MTANKIFNFPTVCTCAHCKEMTIGTIKIDGELRLVDTPGFIILEDGIMCEPCMKKQGLQDPNQEFV
jgi:hypothetical protein